MTVIHSLRERFIADLAVAYAGTEALVASLADFADLAAEANLTGVAKQAREEQTGHLKRIDEVFKILGEERAEGKNRGIPGLLQDTAMQIKDTKASEISDTAIVACLSRVAHVQIATYRALLQLTSYLDDRLIEPVQMILAANEGWLARTDAMVPVLLNKAIRADLDPQTDEEVAAIPELVSTGSVLKDGETSASQDAAQAALIPAEDDAPEKKASKKTTKSK